MGYRISRLCLAFLVFLVARLSDGDIARWYRRGYEYMYIRTDQLAKVLIKGKHKGQPGRYPFTSPGRPGLEIVRSVSPKRTLPGIRLEIRSLAVSWIYQACWSIALVEYELISFGEAFRQVPTRCRSVDHVRYCGVWSSETVLEHVWSDTFHSRP